MQARHVSVGKLTLGNDLPLVFIVGPNTLQSRGHALEMSAALAEMAQKLNIGLIYKTSFDKANRTSLGSERGIGLKAGLPILAEVRERTGLPVLTDIHTPEQCAPVAEVVDVLQTPAFLCRQTDLLLAAGVAGIFLETHENPNRAATAEALTMLPLKALPELIETLIALDRVAKAKPYESLGCASEYRAGLLRFLA